VKLSWKEKRPLPRTKAKYLRIPCVTSILDRLLVTQDIFLLFLLFFKFIFKVAGVCEKRMSIYMYKTGSDVWVRISTIENASKAFFDKR